MMIKSVFQLAMCSVLLASVSASASPMSRRPLAIAASIQETTGPMARCPSQFGGTITGHANSALLGRVVIIASDCITPSGPLFNFSQGRMIIMTVTGEQIFADYSGQFVPTGISTKFVFSNATFQITGGTGKFSKATGGGSLNGGEDMATGQGTIKLSGRISYKDKNRFLVDP